MTAEREAALWYKAGLELGEGPRWVDGRLVLVDILTGTLFEAHDRRLRPLAQINVPLGAVAPLASTPGQWIAAAGTGVAMLSPAGDLDWLDSPAEGGPVSRRMNDGACDPAGRFWAGCMAWDATPNMGGLFRVDPDGSVEQVLEGLTVPNGPAFSPDGTVLYLADSALGIVRRYPLDPATGDLGAPDTFVQLAHGSPDGMTVDAEGSVWVAVWGGGEVRRYTAEGKLAETIRVPTPRPTAPCLGGRDGHTLFVTTARYGLGADQVGLSGDVFGCYVETPGPPAAAFRPSRPNRSATDAPVDGDRITP